MAVVALRSCCIESLFSLDDLDPDCGLAFGRALGVGVDGRLTGVFLFSFSLLSGACPGCEEEVFSCDVHRSC